MSTHTRLALVIALSAILCPSPSQSKTKKIPAAPLPAVVVNAKKLFLSNGGGSNLAYDAFYSKMKEWVNITNPRSAFSMRLKRRLEASSISC